MFVIHYPFDHVTMPLAIRGINKLIVLIGSIVVT
jgi:hypothetical protein